jgi:hypothetical protein
MIVDIVSTMVAFLKWWPFLSEGDEEEDETEWVAIPAIPQSTRHET